MSEVKLHRPHAGLFCCVAFVVGAVFGFGIDHLHFRLGGEKFFISYNELSPELKESAILGETMTGPDPGVALPGPAKAAEKHSKTIRKALPETTSPIPSEKPAQN